MLRLIKGAASIVDKSLVVLGSVPADSLGNIRPNAIGGIHDLLANRLPTKPIPSGDYFPNQVGKFLRKLINAEVLEVCARHRILLPPH